MFVSEKNLKQKKMFYQICLYINKKAYGLYKVSCILYYISYLKY